MKTINIYTDGACSGNQNDDNIGGWGCVLEFAGVQKELCGGEVNTTNNRMELTALIEGLAALKEKGLFINVFSDSSYLVNCFKEKWYEGWIKNGWKNSKKQPVENRELWERLLGLMEGQQLKFFLVKGHLDPEGPESKLKEPYKKFRQHNGDFSYEDFLYIVKMNNRCDALANVFINEHRN